MVRRVIYSDYTILIASFLLSLQACDNVRQDIKRLMSSAHWCQLGVGTDILGFRRSTL